MAKITFSEVAIRIQRHGKCPTCGKPRTRSRKFWQTISPFNRNAAGTPKSEREIRAELQADARAWEPNFTCASHEGQP